MGAVYRARQRKLARDVAIKVLPRQLVACDEQQLRGTSWSSYPMASNNPDRRLFGLSSLRNEVLPEIRSISNGFRIVLVPEAPAEASQ